MDLEEIRTCCESLEQYITSLRMTERIEYYFYSEMIDAVQTIAAEITSPPKSNADRIRQMTDEELAKKLRCDSCLYQLMKSECESSDCAYGILAWLRKEVSEDATD